MSHPLSRAFYANVQSRFPVASGTDPEMPRKLIGEIIIIVKADLLCNDRDGIPVSYTHLDVYKRQAPWRLPLARPRSLAVT